MKRHIYRIHKATGERSKVGVAVDIPDALLLISWDQVECPPSEWCWTMAQAPGGSVFECGGGAR